METIKTYPTSRGLAAILVASCLATPLRAGDDHGSAASRELSRRSAAVTEAQELLLKGDEAYQSGNYADAVEAYAGARELFPDAPATRILRISATQRYAQAAVERARALSKQGDVAGAKKLIASVLNENVAPNDPGALNMQAYLNDPIRTNPALDTEHTQDVDQVRRLLYTAQGAYDLGKFDEASQTYADILRIDPYNTAAQRGLEKTAEAKHSYHKSTYDQTRADLLTQVEKAWETAVPDLIEPDLDHYALSGTGAVGGQIKIQAKLDQIIIPQIALDDSTISEALDFLRLRSAELDTLELDPARKGINFTTNFGPQDSDEANRLRNARFSLRLTNTPISGILKYITAATKTSYTTDQYTVVISPVGSTSDELILRSYRVPPDFLTNLGGTANAAANDDPFADNSSSGSLLAVRMTAQEALAQQGVSFPDGASATYNPGTSTLRVYNSVANQDIISQIVDALSQTEPVSVSVKVTMIKTQQTNLEELGFDWLVTPFPFSDSIYGSGGTLGNGSARTAADMISSVNGVTLDGISSDPDASVTSGLMTNGLRSGDYGITGSSIDSLINATSSSSQSSTVAPGIFGITGLFSDGQAQVIMRGLNQSSGIDLMAQPSVTTRSGQQATVEILREFIYPTEYEPPEVPTSVGSGSTPVTPATPTAFDKKDVGITLEVLPVAGKDRRYVDITLNPSFIDFDGFVNYGSPIYSSEQDILGNLVTTEVTENAILMPVFSAHRANTQLTVADGATIAIGGLLQESVENVQDKVPVLGDIPLVGRLFQTDARESISTAIVILVKVELLDPTGRPYSDR
nr:type II and III secretion system protein [Verrucomicrobiota bacterium JB025]